MNPKNVENNLSQILSKRKKDCNKKLQISRERNNMFLKYNQNGKK